MINFFRRLFGFTSTRTQKEIDILKAELVYSKKEVIVLSNIVGKLAQKVDGLAKSTTHLVAEVDKITKNQLELEFENATLIEGLRSVASPKNRLVAFPHGKDDDDDLIN